MNINDTGTKNTAMVVITETRLDSGTISWRTAGDAQVCTSSLRTATAFVVASGIATLYTGTAAVSAGNPLDSSQSTYTIANTITKAAFVTAGSTVIYTLTVNSVSADITLSSTSVAQSEGIRLTGLTITPA